MDKNKIPFSDKQRAKLYCEFIYELFDEIPNVQENETAKEIHAKMMLLPEFWER